MGDNQHQHPDMRAIEMLAIGFLGIGALAILAVGLVVGVFVGMAVWC